MLKGLKHLTLHGNPCSKMAGYRKHLIDMLPNLFCLDEFIVFDFERSSMAARYPKNLFKGEKLAQLKYFRPYSEAYTSWSGYGPPDYEGMITQLVESS